MDSNDQQNLLHEQDTRKRERSPSGAHESDRTQKVVKLSTGPDLSLKRARSRSVDSLSEDVARKSIKFDAQQKHPDSAEDEDDDENSDEEPSHVQPPDSIELGGAKITNLKLVSIDEHGDEIHLTRTGRATVSDTGLLTPDLTPPLVFGKGDEEENPFNKVDVTSNAHVISSPTKQTSTAHDSPANLAYVGDLELFGTIPAKLYMYQHLSDALHPYAEVVKIAHLGEEQQVSLGMLFPTLKGSDWDAIRLDNPILGFQESVSCSDDLYRRQGLYFETDIVFQGALQPISDFLRDFFGQEKPAISFSAWLSSERSYAEMVTPSTFALMGSLEHICLNVLDILEFHEIGIELTWHTNFDDVKLKEVWEFDYGFFGKLNLKVPGTAVPLNVEYYLRRFGKSWMLSLRLKDDEWNDVFGIKGIKLSEVVLVARLDGTNAGKSSLSFEVGGSLQLRGAQLDVKGCYSKDSYSVEAHLGNLTLAEVGEIFHELVGIELDVFDHDVTFNSMVLRISSGGFELAGQITINGHTSAHGALSFSKDGISVSGGIGDLEINDILIKEASFDVFIQSKMDTHCARASKLAIAGDVCFCGVELRVALYTETLASGERVWTIYGEVDGAISTSNLVPELKETFLDISLNRLALIASNDDKPAGSFTGVKYPITKGVQFCAVIDGIYELEQLMRGSVKGMILRMAYNPGNNFRLSIILPATRTITFSDSVYTGPLEIEIEAGTDIRLLLKAILNVTLDTQRDPLQFALGLKADKVAASAYAQMLTDWTNPCNLGKNVVIRKCALEFGIVYTTFFTTGTPGVIGLAGELAVGSKMAGVAMKLSQNPAEQLLAAQIQDLGVVDLVEFASVVADCEFPKPDDFVHFNNVELYLSTGTTLGLTEYPAGASLKGDMTLFGKRAQFECTVGSKVKIMATIEHFSLGPLTVKGATTPDPIVDIELSRDSQRVLIDGAVEIWGASAATHLEAALFPKPMLDFFVDLRLSDLFRVKLQAQLGGDINIKDPTSWANADFSVYGLMEQHLIEHVTAQLEQQITAAQEAVKHGFDDIKSDMEAKEAAFKAACQVAIDDLEAKRAEWNKKKNEVDAAFNSAHEEATRIRKDLQAKVDEAERSFKGLIADKSAELERARADAAAAIQSAEHDIEDAQRDSDNSIHEAQADLQRVRQEFENSFGSAERDLESAQRDVENAQRRVNDLDRDIAWIERRIDDEPWYNCPPLIAEKAGLWAAKCGACASLEVVRGILCAAEAIVHGTGFVAAEGAIGAAELALEGVRAVKTEALDLAKGALDGVRDVQNGFIQAAIDALHAAETASNELHVFDLAKDALEGGEALAQGAISGAQGAVDGLARCGEFIAFDAAEAALRFAQENTKELNLARHAVEIAEGAVNMGLDIGKWVVQHAGRMFNITKIEFSGSSRALLHGDENSPPLRVSVQGTVLDHDFDIEIVWKPHFDLVAFIKELFGMLWEKIKELAKDLLF